jgi:hypothetical protein
VYLYAADNPVNFIDSNGKQAVCPKSGVCPPETIERQRVEREKFYAEHPEERFARDHPRITAVVEFIQFAGAIIFLAKDISSLGKSAPISAPNIAADRAAAEAAAERAVAEAATERAAAEKAAAERAAAEKAAAERATATATAETTPEKQKEKTPLQLPPGGTTTLSKEKVQNFRGTNKQRGDIAKQHQAELSRGTGQEKASQTALGPRLHDVRDEPSSTNVVFRREVKNYREWLTLPSGEKVKNQVTPSKQILDQIHKDKLWLREGKKLGENRVIQWDFIGAGPSKELKDVLQRSGIPYSQRH